MEKQKRFNFLYAKPAALIVPLVLLALWEVAGWLGYIPKTILPRPSLILEATIRLIRKTTLQKDIGISLYRVIRGYLIGASLGIVVGIILGIFRSAENLLSLLLNILRPIPIIAWVPVLILWMGIGETSKVTVIAIGTFWPVLLNTIDGIHNVDKKYKEVAALFKKSRFVTLRKVVFPAAIPTIFTGLRISIGSAWISVIGAEMIASSSGLGYLISYSRELAQPASMLVGVFVIGLIGTLINSLLLLLQRKLVYWN